MSWPPIRPFADRLREEEEKRQSAYRTKWQAALFRRWTAPPEPPDQRELNPEGIEYERTRAAEPNVRPGRWIQAAARQAERQAHRLELTMQRNVAEGFGPRGAMQQQAAAFRGRSQLEQGAETATEFGQRYRGMEPSEQAAVRAIGGQAAAGHYGVQPDGRSRGNPDFLSALQGGYNATQGLRENVGEALGRAAPFVGPQVGITAPWELAGRGLNAAGLDVPLPSDLSPVTGRFGKRVLGQPFKSLLPEEVLQQEERIPYAGGPLRRLTEGA